MNDRHAGPKFAVFAAACLVIAAWIVVVIGNIAPFAERRTFTGEFASAQGLVPDDSVRVAGVDVGKVEAVEVRRGRALVTFTVDDGVRIGVDSTLAVRWRNTLGLRYLYVETAGAGDLPASFHFPVERTRSPADVNTLLARLTPVMRALDPAVSNVVVRELAAALEGREDDVRALTTDAADVLEVLGERSEAIGRVLRNGTEVLGAYADREEQLRDVISGFADVSESVEARNDVLVEAIDAIGAVEVELARVLRDDDADIRGLVAALDRAALVLSANHEEVERTVRTLAPGIVSYHRISRWGQWFNIRVPGASIGEDTVATERGATLPPRQGGASGDTTSGASWGDVFRLRAG
ncbi:MAG: MCE family protein [Actinobacteria bacterium]|nr:MCE family protein [Actinomycetota bacterium]